MNSGADQMLRFARAPQDFRTNAREISGGFPVAGYSVGILCLKTKHPLLPGNVQHAQSYRFPVVYEIVEVSEPWLLMTGDTSLNTPILAAAERLRDAGVRAITGACGSFAFYQDAVKNAVKLPVFMSPMLMVPLLLNALADDRKLGIICGAAASIDPRILEQCKITERDRIVIAEMRGQPEFDRMLSQSELLDAARLESETIAVARRMVEENPAVSALLLQCSDLPPFAAGIQACTRRPVFDMTRMVEWVGSAASCRSFDW